MVSWALSVDCVQGCYQPLESVFWCTDGGSDCRENNFLHGHPSKTTQSKIRPTLLYLHIEKISKFLRIIDITSMFLMVEESHPKYCLKHFICLAMTALEN